MKDKYPTHKRVKLDYLRVEIFFYDLSKLKGIEIKGSGFTTIQSEDEMANLEIGVFLSDIENLTLAHMPMVMHEIVHILQIICEKRSMQFENEVEHTAYIAHYLLEQLLGEALTK